MSYGFLFHLSRTRLWACSVRSTAVGISLTVASTVANLEPGRSAVEENRVLGRIHRIKQTRDVSVLRLVAKGSIEEKLRMLQERGNEEAACSFLRDSPRAPRNDPKRVPGRDTDHKHLDEYIVERGDGNSI